MSLFDQGERRHETCRWGDLTPMFVISVETRREVPDVAPICRWTSTEPKPPALIRSWGGLIEFARDCAVCPCHQALEAKEPSA